MSRQPPHPQMDIPISMVAYQQLLGASCNTGFEKEHWEIAAEAIDEWVRRHNPDAIPMPAAKGYQWKSLFLPDGTLLRTVFGGKNHHCLVENDQISYNGQAVSPSGFVNAVGGIRRNAWRSTWILLPDAKEWKLADTLRTRERPRHERQPARAFQQSPARPPCAPQAPANVPPAAGPIPEQAEPIAAGVSEERCSQSASLDTVQRTGSHGEGRSWPRRTAPSLSPPRCSCGADRRASGDDRIPPSLREQLLPLLYRICTLEEERPGNR